MQQIRPSTSFALRRKPTQEASPLRTARAQPCQADSQNWDRHSRRECRVGGCTRVSSGKIDEKTRKIRDALGAGAQGWNRTTDTTIFSRMLYQLSYLGMLSMCTGKALAGLVDRLKAPAL